MAGFRQYLRFAERCCARTRSATAEGADASPEDLMASILFSWISLEAFVNSMLITEASSRSRRFDLAERAFLNEREIEFVDHGSKAGELRLSKRQYFPRLDDKILFLLRKCGINSVNVKGGSLWTRFVQFRDRRNAIAHPRRTNPVDLCRRDATDGIEIAKEMIKLLAAEIWAKEIEF